MVNKYASHLNWSDKEDLKQEAQLALFIANNNLSNGLAYRIIERKIIDCLRKRPPKMEDIDNPNIIRKCNKQTYYELDVDKQLDMDKAVHLVNSLPDPYKTVLTATFGYITYTEKDLANMLGKTERWVKRIKFQGLQKLRKLMGVK